MKCLEVGPRLCAYLDNELLDSSENEVAEHLAVCGRCKALRDELFAAHFYLTTLKGEPKKAFRADIASVLNERFTASPAEIYHRRVLTAFIVSGLALAASVYLAGPFLNLEAGRVIAVRHEAAQKKIYSLAEPGKISLNAKTPALIDIGQKSWMSLKGKADIFREDDSIRVNLAEGEVYLLVGNEFSGRSVINAGAFQIKSLKTEFCVSVYGTNVDISLLSGLLSVKYGDDSGLKAVQLSAGQGASGKIQDGRPELKLYNLSAPQKAVIQTAVNKMRALSAPKTGLHLPRFAPSQIRMEFWKGD